MKWHAKCVPRMQLKYFSRSFIKKSKFKDSMRINKKKGGRPMKILKIKIIIRKWLEECFRLVTLKCVNRLWWLCAAYAACTRGFGK